jgi:anti-anti-sigma regulatory factor
MADQSLRVLERAGVSIVVIQGDLVADRADLWRLLADLRGPVVIDCARVQSADSVAVSALRAFDAGTTTLSLRRVPDPLRKLLDDHDLLQLVAYAERESGRRHHTSLASPVK